MPAIPRPPRITAPGGVAVRPLRGRDARPFAAAFGADPGLGATIGAEAPRPAEVRRLIAAQPVLRAGGRRVDVAVTERGAFAGAAGLHSFDWPARRAQIGFWLVPSSRGRGVGPAAVGALAGWAFAGVGLERLELLTAPENGAARALAARLGFAETGEAREPGSGRRLLVHARIAGAG
jgi:RimJ/RimL family protein N-acetyltransferase